jgi:predicted ATPase with chaperone activity
MFCNNLCSKSVGLIGHNILTLGLIKLGKPEGLIGHSILLVGPPGTGKSMLAARFAGILPAMTDAEALEAAAVQSLAGSFVSERWRRRSYRAPHHTASAVALVGGGCHFHLKTRRYTHRRD